MCGFICEPHAKLQHPYGQGSNHALPKRGSKAAGLKAAGNASAFQSADCLLHPSSPDLLRTCPSAAASDSRPPTSNESWFRKRLSQPLTIPRFHLRLGWGARVAPLPAPSLPLPQIRAHGTLVNGANNPAAARPIHELREWSERTLGREWYTLMSLGAKHNR